MYKIIYVVVAVFVMQSIIAQNFQKIDSLETYFTENAKSLDKIEGFWKVHVINRFYENDSLVDKVYNENRSYWAIVRKDEVTFNVIDIGSGSAEDNEGSFTATFEKLPLDWLYFYTCNFHMPSWSRMCISEFYDENRIHYRYYVSEVLIIDTHAEGEAGNLEIEWEFFWERINI